ncbi:MAG: hypothetical protein R3B45_17775 [Bdellovibrionota bacterium]
MLYKNRNKTFDIIKLKYFRCFLVCCLILLNSNVLADADYVRALKRAQYLLNESTPTDAEFSQADSLERYRTAVRAYIDSDKFYHVVLRYHERLLGIGLPTSYLDELMNDNIDEKANKFAKIECGRQNDMLRCYWSSASEGSKVSSCPSSWEKAVSIFWYPGIVACGFVLRFYAHVDLI